MRWRKPLFVASLAAVGCINEYHPEYHPVTSYTVSQYVSYSTTVVQNVVGVGSGPELASRPKRLQRVATPTVLPPPRSEAGAVQGTSATVPATAETPRFVEADAPHSDRPMVTHILATITVEDYERLGFLKGWPADSRDVDIHPEGQPSREIRGFHASTYRDPKDRAHGMLELYTREPMAVGSVVLLTREVGRGETPVLAYGRVVDDS